MLFYDLQTLEIFDHSLFEVCFILAPKKENHLIPRYEIILLFLFLSIFYSSPSSLTFCTACILVVTPSFL